MVCCSSQGGTIDFHVHCEGVSTGKKGHEGHIIICFLEKAFCLYLLKTLSNIQKALVHKNRYII